MQWNRGLWLLAFVVACGDDGNTSGIPDQCNPLGGQGCLLPWPSLTYTTEDASTATGIRLDVPREAMPKNVDGIVIEPDSLNRWDGFSAIGPMLASFDTGVSPAGLPSFHDPDASLAADSPIVVVDIDSGERVPFFAEVDMNSSDIAKRNLIIRPLARLKTKAHFAVGIRTTVKAADGGELAISPGFAALRDGKSFEHPRFDAMKSRADAMFAALERAGLPRAETALAWDFATASDDFLHADLLAMRDAALSAIGPAGAQLTFTATTQPNTATTFKRYLGTFDSPNFLTNGEMDDSIMQRDAAHEPQMSGMRRAQFAAIIPACVQNQPLPRPTIIFGHGLFGSAKEYLNDDFVAQLAEEHCLVILATDFIGLTSRQLALAPLAINDLNRGPQLTEKLAQSIIDFISLESIARGPMATAPEFQVNGKAVIDPQKTFYVGGSLGGIMGNVFMAYDPNITRGILAVPGGNWSMLMERSNAWSLLMGAAQGAYPDPSLWQINLALLGMGLEPYDAMTTAAHVLKDPLPGSVAKNILMWYSTGDCLVTNISTEMVAREMGIQMLGPSVRTPWHLTPTAGPLANGITLYDDHPTPLPPETNQPPLQDNGTHSGINKKPSALRQVQAFLLDPKQATDTCIVGGNPAPCDCATGACN